MIGINAFKRIYQNKSIDTSKGAIKILAGTIYFPDFNITIKKNQPVNRG